jgi:hypothetical protein
MRRNGGLISEFGLAQARLDETAQLAAADRPGTGDRRLAVISRQTAHEDPAARCWSASTPPEHSRAADDARMEQAPPAGGGGRGLREPGRWAGLAGQPIVVMGN